MTDFKKLAYKQREEFISTLNHDLKIPIIAQIRALELLVKEDFGSLNSTQKEMLNLTLTSCKSVYKMISGVLSSYKYENRDIVLDLEITDIAEILNKCLQNNKILLAKKHINFVIKSSNALNLIRADKVQLKKAFEYIVNYCISNSISDIECKIAGENDIAQIDFIFENPYGTQEKLNNVFLSRMDKVGCSLGLYLARQIINAHNGIIKLYNLGVNNICSVTLLHKI